MSKSTKILVTGLPGAGKSYVSSFFGAFELDQVGQVIDGKWIVDVRKIPLSSKFYAGTCDNMDEVIGYLKPGMIIFITAAPSFMRRTAGAKLRDLPPDAPDSFREGFRAKTTMTNKQYKSAVSVAIKHLFQFAPVWELMNPGADVVKHGWHK